MMRKVVKQFMILKDIPSFNKYSSISLSFTAKFTVDHLLLFLVHLQAIKDLYHFILQWHYTYFGILVISKVLSNPSVILMRQMFSTIQPYLMGNWIIYVCCCIYYNMVNINKHFVQHVLVVLTSSRMCLRHMHDSLAFKQDVFKIS